MRGINLEVDGLSVDALVNTSDSSRLVLDLSLDVGKVVELAARDMVKFCPLGSPRSSGRSIGIAQRIGSLLIFGNVDELENQGPSSNDAASAR